MVNIKYKDINPINEVRPNHDLNSKKTWFKIAFPLLIVLFMYFTIFMGVVFYFMVRIDNLEKEVNFCKNNIEEIKYKIQKMGLKANVEDYHEFGFLPDYAIEDPVNLQRDEKVTGEYIEDGTEESTFKFSSKESRVKREVVGVTDDGVPVNAETYSEFKRQNATRSWMRMYDRLSSQTVPPNSSPISNANYDDKFIKHILNNANKPVTEATLPPTVTPKPTVFNRQFRVLYPDDKSNEFRQILKKNFFKSADPYIRENEERQGHDFTNSRGYLETFTETAETLPPRMGRHRPLVTTHFSGDTSKFVVGQHNRFNGNGHIRHSQKTFVDWKQSSWVNTQGMGSHFAYDEGTVTIKESGIYFIYAQIYYLDVHDLNGFRVYKNEESILLQCTITSSSAERVLKGNTCYTAGAEFLEEGDKVSVADIADGRYTLFEPGKSFFGLFKLGDARK